ncbi:MAG TPA: sigma-70 family RNA polymerase sigma factor [Polyangiaceae bacterium]
MTDANLQPAVETRRASWMPTASFRPSMPATARRRPASVLPRAAHRPAALQPATVVKREPAPARPKKEDPRVARLIKEYTPLVHKIVGGFQRRLPRNVLREDLIAAGMVGLWDAIRRHGEEPDEGFEWYVRVRVRGAILDELRAEDWLSRRARAAAAATSDSQPPRVVRLDDVGEWEQSRSLASEDSSETELDRQATQASLNRAVEALPERERLIVAEHYFNEVKFKSLGERLGVSEPRVSQLHSRAMQRLRTLVAEQGI